MHWDAWESRIPLRMRERLAQQQGGSLELGSSAPLQRCPEGLHTTQHKHYEESILEIMCKSTRMMTHSTKVRAPCSFESSTSSY